MEEAKKVYVAGPMSKVGPPTWNFPAFRKVASRITAKGWHPVVPIEEGDLTDDGQPTKEKGEYLRRDVRMLTDCDAVALLPEWWDSGGARLEARNALAFGLDFYDAETLMPIARAAVEAVLDSDPEGADDRSVLEEAQDIIHGDRNADYGHPSDNHGCTAQMVSAYLHRKYGYPVALSAEDVCWFNVLQKISRQANKPKRDNLTDAVGYIGNIEMIGSRE